MPNNIHPLADVKTDSIGENTRVWQFSVIMDGARIGDHCNINCHTFIENDVILGDRVTVKSGVFLWNGLRVENDVFIGPNVTFINDLSPRSKKYPEKFLQIEIRENSSIGANATILGGISIGKYAMIGAASLVTKSVPDYALVYGNPAKIEGWFDNEGNRLKEDGEFWKDTEGNTYKIENSQRIKIA